MVVSISLVKKERLDNQALLATMVLYCIWRRGCVKMTLHNDVIIPFLIRINLDHIKPVKFRIICLCQYDCVLSSNFLKLRKFIYVSDYPPFSCTN